MSDTVRFVRRMLTQPKTVGAVVPSSRALGRAMAAEIDPSQQGYVLELGPGTGVATAALIARGIAPDRIVAVEYDPAFARLIAERFPGVTVINGDAFILEKTLGEHVGVRFIGAVSGLPLLNFTIPQRQVFIAGVLARLEPGAPHVQFSYSLNAPPVPPPADATVTRGAFVLLNLPPARVWVYRHS